MRELVEVMGAIIGAGALGCGLMAIFTNVLSMIAGLDGRHKYGKQPRRI